MSRKYTVTLLEKVQAETISRNTTGEYFDEFDIATFKVSVQSYTEFESCAKYGYAPHGQKVNHSATTDEYMYLVPDSEIDMAKTNQNFILHQALKWNIGESYEVCGHLQYDKGGHYLVIEDDWW